MAAASCASSSASPLPCDMEAAGSSFRPLCGLSGCPKPIHGSLSSSGSLHLACGEFHHFLLMAARFHPSAPPPHLSLFDRNHRGFCAYLSCENPPFPSGHFCSRTHHLAWLSEFCNTLSPLQKCRFRDCHRHVFVESPSPASPQRRAHEFCGWRHRQSFTIIQAFESRGRDEQSPSSPSSSPPSSPPSPAIGNRATDVNSSISALRKFAQDGKTPENLPVIDQFFSKHPWEVLKGNQLIFIAACMYMPHNNGSHKIQKRKMTTKESYHWKQQGPGSKVNGISKKHFTYIRLKSKKKTSTDLYNRNLCAPKVTDGVYGMTEYTIEDVSSHCLVKLFKRSGRHINHLEHAGSPHSTVTEGVVRIDITQEDTHEESGSTIFSGLPNISELELDNNLLYLQELWPW